MRRIPVTYTDFFQCFSVVIDLFIDSLDTMSNFMYIYRCIYTRDVYCIYLYIYIFIHTHIYIYYACIYLYVYIDTAAYSCGAFRFRKGGKAKTVPAPPPEIVQVVQEVEVDEMVQVGSVVELWLPYSDSWDNNSEYDSD